MLLDQIGSDTEAADCDGDHEGGKDQVEGSLPAVPADDCLPGRSFVRKTFSIS